MSCGNPHDTPCTEVLDRVYEYIDNELGSTDRDKIKQHLEECSPCLQEVGLEEIVKSLVKRTCGHDDPPEDLRAKVLAKISAARAQLADEKTPQA